MTTTTNTMKVAAVQQPANGHVEAAPQQPLTPSFLFTTGISVFLGEVEGIMADENDYYKLPFMTLPDYFRRGVDSAQDKLWPELMEMVRLLQQTRRGRTIQENEKFHQLALKVVKYLCYTEGMGAVERAAVERAAVNAAVVRPDSSFTGN